MDKTETHDFMNVDSFSQLPFIRPGPGPAPASSSKDKPIRLFGIEFGSSSANSTSTATTQDSSDPPADPPASEEAKEAESGRKFECHYCCRNFPTSQALGGHQNAHKRERQHAKRAHLQSALLHHADHHHIYGAAAFVNYHHHRLTGSVPPPPPPSLHYPSWNTASTNSGNTFASHHSRYYGSQPTSFSQAVPINGSPLGTWRVPAVHPQASFSRDRSLLHPLPLFASENPINAITAAGGAGAVAVAGAGNSSSSSSNNGATHQTQYLYDSAKANVQDHVSLDLHL